MKTRKTIATVMILITVILMDLLAGMEFDLFVPSFPELKSQFNLSPFWVEALLSVNFAGYAISLFFVGGLADRYGRKPIILLGIIVFLIGSILCLWPGSYPFLLAGRFLQGIGVAAPSILSFLIIADAYPLKQQQFYMAMLNGVMNISVGIAPVLGSYITLYFHWQGNFIALFLLAVLVLVMTAIFIPSYKLPEHKETLSLTGYVPIFQSKTLMLLIGSIVFAMVPYWVFVGMSPLLYMQNLDVSLTHFGYYQGALATVFALGSVVYGLKMHKYDQTKMLNMSFWITVLSLITMGSITFLNSMNPLVITLAFIPFIISQVIPATILYPICLNLMPKAKGRVSAVLQAGRLVLASLCLQIAGYFYVGSFRNIGIVLITFIFLTVVGLYWVLRNREIMTFSSENEKGTLT